MAEKSTEELQRIVTLLRNDYQPDAVTAAEAELRSRGVQPGATDAANAPGAGEETEAVEAVYPGQEDNPENRPQQAADPFQTPRFAAEYAYATRLRWLEFLIDYALLMLLEMQLIPEDESSQLGFSLLCGPLLFFLYYFLTESLFEGRTLGKWLLGMRVVDLAGNRPSTGRIAIRSLCRLIPFDAFSFLGNDGWTSDHNVLGNWHDAISRTYTVDEKRLKAFFEQQSAQ